VIVLAHRQQGATERTIATASTWSIELQSTFEKENAAASMGRVLEPASINSRED
jgi:hypothetical protein